MAILFLVGAGSAYGYVAQSPAATLADGRGELFNDLPRPSLNGMRADTVYFGGDDGTGMAYLGGVWDWDTIVSDPLQGWITQDMTEDPADYFYRVNADSFAVHGDGCTPMMGFGTWQIWCGVHEDDADLRDFVCGMGYANNSCQRAISPRYATGASLPNVEFEYFNDTEIGFDYVYVYVNYYNALGDLVSAVEVDRLDGIIGAYDAPAHFNMGPATADAEFCELEFRFTADGGWSDEDGSWCTECGPFAADNVQFFDGTTNHVFDFESGAQGWTFGRCAGIGADMAVWDQATWSQWLEDVGVACSCPLSGNALGFCTEDVPYSLPGFKQLHHEYGKSGILDRGPYLPPDYNSVYVRMAAYFYLRQGGGSFVRPGWTVYPYSSETNPDPHWSPRGGQNVYNYTGDTPGCAYAAGIGDWDLSSPPDGDPIPPTWELMRFIFETITDCEGFQVPPTVCLFEGETFGSPLLDRCQIGLTYAPDAPAITPETGMIFHDGYGQKFPTYLEPSDVANSNVAYDLSRDNEGQNDWNADTSAVSGPVVNAQQPRRWLARFCVKVDRKGPRQDLIPGYLKWKNRLAYAGNVEQDYVCVQMDSVQIAQGPYKHKFATYFHEAEAGFDATHPDYSYWQEILPDSIFVPGTRISYQYQSRWFDGAEYRTIGPWEMEILPNMRLVQGEDYTVEWPCVLYIDRFNRGSEYYITPTLDQVGLEYDKYDALDGSSNWDAPIKRSFGGTKFNPGGWGNNGMTTDQALGYRLILFSLGTFGLSACEIPDFELLELWLTTTQCGLADTRRALIMNGDQIAGCMGHPTLGQANGFLNNVLGTTYDQDAYRSFNNDWAYCVWLEPAAGAYFAPSAPGVGLYGNGCPNAYSYNVLGVQPGVSGALGNLNYYSFQGTGTNTYVSYAQVARQYQQAQVGNWRTVVDGFSFHHVSERGCNGEPCSADSNCVVQGAAELLGPELTWLAAGGAPFAAWQYPCEDDAVGDGGETHLSGPVNFLYAARPNPFRGTAAIRFNLASATRVNLAIYDVSGRLVRTLIDGAMDKGEYTQSWDGADNAGNRVAGGIFWMQMSTANGYVSSKKMVSVR
jgi:hypothetical protein